METVKKGIGIILSIALFGVLAVTFLWWYDRYVEDVSLVRSFIWVCLVGLIGLLVAGIVLVFRKGKSNSNGQ